MSPVVVDTNVGIAANGDEGAGLQCQLACVDRLEHAIENGVVAVDDGGRIFEEYPAHRRRDGIEGLACHARSAH